jgi:hypothetical protein
MRAAVLAMALVMAVASGAAAQDSERAAMAQIRFTTEPAAASGCSHINSAKDNSLRDLRRKIVRAGGNMAVLSFHVDDLSTMFAEIYRCGGFGPGSGAPGSGMPGATAPPPPVMPPAPPPPPPPPSPPMR